MKPKKFFRNSVSRDFFNLMCGEKISHGMTRVVYECRVDPTKVIKFETGSGEFQNVIEWDTWLDMKNGKAAKFLAPCHFISPCGTILIMERTFKPIKGYKWPKNMPAWFTDFKYQNFGMLGKRLVCHDYGTHRATSSWVDSVKTRKANWWDENGK